MVAFPAIPALDHLPRLRTVLADVLGLAPCNAHLDLDRADALACDEADRDEVRTTLDRRFGIALAEDEVEACESIADLLRLLAAHLAGPPHAHA